MNYPLPAMHLLALNVSTAVLQGWPIFDCTLEGLKVVLLLSKLPLETVEESLNMEQLFDDVNVILPLQNADGGFATDELS